MDSTSTIDDYHPDKLPPVLVSFLAYCVLSYITHRLVQKPKGYEQLSRGEYFDYFGQYVSIVHSLISLTLSLASYFYHRGVHYNAPFTVDQTYIFGHSIGYFLYDLAYGEVFGIHNINNAMRIHHVCTCLGGITCYMSPVGGASCLMCLVVTEIANPCNLTRQILTTQKKENTDFFKRLERVFAALFITSRLFIGTFLSYNMWASNISFLVKLCVSSVYGTGLFWIYLILRKIARLFVEAGRLHWFLEFLDWFKARMALFMVGVFVWSLVVPLVLVYGLNAGPCLIEINDFIIV
jgi:hypothetical protein